MTDLSLPAQSWFVDGSCSIRSSEAILSDGLTPAALLVGSGSGGGVMRTASAGIGSGPASVPVVVYNIYALLNTMTQLAAAAWRVPWDLHGLSGLHQRLSYSLWLRVCISFWPLTLLKVVLLVFKRDHQYNFVGRSFRISVFPLPSDFYILQELFCRSVPGTPTFKPTEKLKYFFIIYPFNKKYSFITRTIINLVIHHYMCQYL